MFQVRPAQYTIHAIVTSSDLQFDQTEVDFGHCSICHFVRTTVCLTNMSILPQDFGFVAVPEVCQFKCLVASEAVKQIPLVRPQIALTGAKNKNE